MNSLDLIRKWFENQKEFPLFLKLSHFWPVSMQYKVKLHASAIHIQCIYCVSVFRFIQFIYTFFFLLLRSALRLCRDCFMLKYLLNMYLTSHIHCVHFNAHTFLLANAFFSFSRLVYRSLSIWWSFVRLYFVQQFEIYVKFLANKFSVQTMNERTETEGKNYHREWREKMRHTHTHMLTTLDQ